MYYKIIIILIFIYGNVIFAQSNSNTVQYLQEILIDSFINIANYDFPTDAKHFKATNEPIEGT